MKRITVDNYKLDRFYPRIVRAVDAILGRTEIVAPIEVLIEMGLLSEEAVQEWGFGRIPFLEKSLRCNLAEASRILRVLRMHAHDLNLRPSHTEYYRRGERPTMRLQFAKTRDRGLEEAYSCHLIRSPSKKRKAPSPTSASPKD